MSPLRGAVFHSHFILLDIEDELSQVLALKRGYDSHPLYWRCVARLLCQGRPKEAADLLQLHSDHLSSERVSPLFEMETCSICSSHPDA